MDNAVTRSTQRRRADQRNGKGQNISATKWYCLLLKNFQNSIRFFAVCGSGECVEHEIRIKRTLKRHLDEDESWPGASAIPILSHDKFGRSAQLRIEHFLFASSSVSS
jgi:hypothetical protein